MPAGDSRLNELTRLRNRLLELETQLKEEKKISARLREQSEKKFHQATTVDAEIQAENERFQDRKEELHTAIRNDNETTQALIAEMKKEEVDLLEEISDFDLIQYDNERLHNKLKELSAFHRQTVQDHNEEQTLKSQKDFDLRMEMEEILRKTIKNVDDAYRLEAVSSL